MLFRYAFLALALSATAATATPVEDLRKVITPTPRYILRSPAGKVDNLFEIVSTPRGFLLSFARSVGSIPPFTLYTQRYTTAGKPIGGPVVIDGPGTIGDHVKMARVNATTAVAAWLAAGQVKVGRLSLTTGKVSGARLIGKSDDHIHDVAALPGGKIAVVTPQITPLPLPGKYKIALKILSPSLGTVADWRSVNGAGFPLDRWAYYDQTVVSRGTGGTVIYRDHVTQKIMGRNFSASGGLGSTVTLSTAPFASFSVLDIAYIEVKAVRLTTGKVAACWTATTKRPGGRYTVRCRLLSAAGRPIGKEFAPSIAKGSQTSPDVVALPGNRFTVLWTQQDIVFPNAVKFRTYNATGRALTDVQTGATLTGLHISPNQTEATAQPNGSIVSALGGEFTTPGIMAFSIPKPVP